MAAVGTTLAATLLAAPIVGARGAARSLPDVPTSVAPDETPPTVADAAPKTARGAYVAKLLEPTPAYATVDDAKPFTRLATRTRYTHSGTRLLVTDAGYDPDGRLRLRVVVPLKPTGRSAWIHADQVGLSVTRWWVRVDLRRRLVSVLRDGRVVRRFRAVIGASATPTPIGMAALYETVGASHDRVFTGPWALHLTAFSRVLDRYGAGDGRVAIHGRGPAALVDPLGSARSHGCVRVDNGAIRFMRSRLPLGTPVEIESGR